MTAVANEQPKVLEKQHASTRPRYELVGVAAQWRYQVHTRGAHHRTQAAVGCKKGPVPAPQDLRHFGAKWWEHRKILPPSGLKASAPMISSASVARCHRLADYDARISHTAARRERMPTIPSVNTIRIFRRLIARGFSGTNRSGVPKSRASALLSIGGS